MFKLAITQHRTMFKLAIAVFAAVTTTTAASATVGPTGTPESVGRKAAEAYLAFGSTPAAPFKHTCANWVALYTPNGTSVAPGGPQNDATGSKALLGLCNAIVSNFGAYFGAIEHVQADMSADGKTMLGVAFKWSTYATSAKTGATIIVPAISYIDFDAEGKFAYTRDFFNPTGLPMGVTQLMGRDFSGFTASGTSDDDGTAAAVKYFSFGALPASPSKYDCPAWVALFTPNGTSVAPGGPQNAATGTTALLGLCKAIVSGFGVSLGVLNGVYTDMSVDGKTMLGVAFKWTVAATNAKTGAQIINPAITYINFDADGKFAYTRDFFDPANLPPGSV